MSVLSALLDIPSYSNRVWIYVRSTTTLFGGGGGDTRSPGFASVALEAERATGQYTMTIALLHLVEGLFRQAYVSILPKNVKLQQLKEEVLLRAMRFVHTEIWVEHMSWKYAQLGDRFDIGRKVLQIYVQVITNSPPTTNSISTMVERPFPVLSQAVADVLLFKATTSTINPIVSAISTGEHMLKMLRASRRHGDVYRTLLLLQATLQLCRLILTYKLNSSIATRSCLLEQALCARVAGGAGVTDKTHLKQDPIDVLASYVTLREVGSQVPVESTKLLCALLSSLSTSSTSPPTIIGHLSNPEVTITSLVRIIHHPYDDLALRKAVWNFVSLAVDKEPALATLLVTGKSRAPIQIESREGKDKSRGKEIGTGKELEKKEDKT